MPARHAGIWQPGPGSRVDTQHPLGQGCVLAMYGSATEHGLYWQDISGQNNHGTLTNMDLATDWVEGRNGWGLDIDSTDDYVSISLSASSVLCQIGAAYSVVLSCYVTSARATDYVPLVTWSTSANSWRSSLLTASGTNAYAWRTRAVGGSSTDDFAGTTAWRVSSGNWRNGAATWNAGVKTLYLDGTQVAQKSVAYSICGLADAGWFHIGRCEGGYPSDAAKWSWVIVYNRALDAEEIKRLYAEPYAHIWTPGRKSTWWASAAGGTTYEVTCAETVTATDARSNATARTLGESVATADALARLLSRSLSESVGVTDAAARTLGRILAEALTLADGRSNQLARSLPEAATVSDARALLLGRTLAEQATVTDSLTRLLARELAEALGVTDDVAAQTVGIIRLALEETLGVTDAVARDKLLILAVTLVRDVLNATLGRDVLDATLVRDIIDGRLH